MSKTRAMKMSNLYAPTLKEDPAELRDLSACPEQQENLARLRALLERYRDQWEDLPSEISQTFWSRY